jgi:hypothetical protein
MAVSYAYDLFATATPADTNLATLLTLGATEELVQAEVMCCNKSASDLTVRVGIGTGASPDAYLCYDFTLYANLFVRFYIPGLGSSNKVFVRTSSASNVDFSISGLKKTTA